MNNIYNSLNYNIAKLPCIIYVINKQYTIYILFVVYLP